MNQLNLKSFLSVALCKIPLKGLIKSCCFVIPLFGLLLSGCDKNEADTPILQTGKITAHSDTQTVFANKTTLINPLANDVLAAGDFALTFAPAKHGTIIASANKPGFYYAPEANFTGTDSVKYTISQLNQIASAWVYLTVSDSVNCPLLVQPDSLIAYQNGGGASINVLRNDAVCGIYTLSTTGKPAHGSLLLEKNGNLTFTPYKDFIGTDTAAYQVCRGSVCTSAAVYIKVAYPQTCYSRFAATTDYLTDTAGTSFFIPDSVLTANDIYCPNDLQKAGVTYARLRSTLGSIITIPGSRGTIYSYNLSRSYYADSLAYTITSASRPDVKSTGKVVIHFTPKASSVSIIP